MEIMKMTKIRRIAALLTVLLIAVLVIGTLICGILGSPYFYGMLFLTIVVPVVLWVFMWFTHLIHGDSKVISKEDMKALEEAKAKKKDVGTKKGTEPE